MSRYLNAMRNYATFSGRPSRSDYWLFILFTVIAVCIAAIADAIIGTSNAGDFGLLAGITAIAHIIPSYAILARRLHDANLSAWLLLGLVDIHLRARWLALRKMNALGSVCIQGFPLF